MYYRFSSDICKWGQVLLQARPVDKTEYLQLRKVHWWEAKPWIPPPTPLVFALDPKAPHLDNYFTGTLFDLYSARLISLLREAEVRFETFPAQILDSNTGGTVPLEYEVFHLLEKRSYKSVGTLQDSPRRLLFRDAERFELVFIHEDLKATLDKAGISGCLYSPAGR